MSESIHSKLIKNILILERKFSLFKVIRKIINEAIYHVEISPSSFKSEENIKTMRLPHPYNIIIHGNTLIGHNVTIFQNTTVGVIEKGVQPKPPIIKDEVYIGANALILGNITLEKGSKIGAGSIILKDVKENTTVVGLYK